MARKKVQLRYIVDAAARKASLKKRRHGLLKKVHELSILCNVQACAIVYGEDKTEPPVHWPEDGGEVDMVLQRFQACPELERRKKMVTKDEYMRQRTEKYKEQAKRIQNSVHEMEMLHLMQLIHVDGRPHCEFTTSELKRLTVFMSEKVRELERKADVLAKAGNTDPPPPPPPHHPTGGVPMTIPLASPSAAAGDFRGYVDLLRRRTTPSESSMPEKVLLPFPRPSEGSTWRFPATARNFEVGGGSGMANGQDGNHDAFSGHGALLQMGPGPAIAGGIGNDPISAPGAVFPCTTSNVGGYANYPYEWNNNGGLGLNMEPVGAIGEEYVNVGPYIGQLQPGPGSNTGQFSGIGDVVRGYINVSEYLAPPHGYIGGITSLHNPMLGGNTNILGGFGYNVEAPPETIPRAVNVSIAPPSLTLDISNPNRGRSNDPRVIDHRSRASGRGI